MQDIEFLCKKLEDAIYDEAVEPKVKLIREINSHRDKQKVYEKERIIAAIVRTLNEDFKRSPDLTRIILTFIRGYGENVGFKSEAEMMGLFQTLVKIQAFENKRFESMREKHNGLKKKVQTKLSFAETFLKETKHMNTIIAKQNQIAYLSMTIARSIAELTKDIEAPDMKHWQDVQNLMLSYLKLIVYNLDRNDQALILLTLETISDFVQNFGIPKDINKTYLSLRLQRFFKSMVYMAPYVIFAKLFVRKAFSEAELKLVVPDILQTPNDKYFRDNISNLISLISSNNSVKETLIEKELFLGILGMYLTFVEKKSAKGINKFEKFDLMRALVNSLINLASNTEQANLMIKSPLFKKLIQYAFDTKDIGLLKLVNNITYFCEPSLTVKFMKERVLIIRDNVEQLGSNTKVTRPALYEMISILSNCCLGDGWEGFLSKNLLGMINTFLQENDGPLRLQTILLVAQLCRNEKTATIFQKRETLDLIFARNPRAMDREELFQKLFVAYQLLLIDFKLDAYMSEIIPLIDTFLENEFSHRNVRVVSFLNEILFILQVKYKSNEIQALVIKR
jgi:CRISPR/Cas system-associated exonuclease Cas4 (RecB family)